MNIIEQEGKRYIEFNNVLIVIITAIICFVIAMFIFIHLLASKADQIYSNPLIYGAKIYNVSSCTCTDGNGYFFFDKEKIWRTEGNIPIIKK